jgi:cardiolipin synthase
MRAGERARTWLFALLTSAVAFLIVALYSVKKRQRPRLNVEDGQGSFPDLIPSLVGITQGTLLKGNAIRLVQNGDFFESLHRDLLAAKETINFETFLCKKGEVSHRIAEILTARAREGVQVRMLLDGSGGREIGPDDVEMMRKAGVHVRLYHPFAIGNLGIINNRDHRKLVIVDGRVGYIGGHCLVDNWLGNAEDPQHYRDISARVEGPVVGQLQSTFGENWIEATGEVPGGVRFFPHLEAKGTSEAHVVWVSPSGSPSTVKLMHFLAISSAKKSIRIQNPYFLPDKDARRALLDAVERGVDVRVMIPHHEISDAPIVQHASHHRYGVLLEGGVRIFDYKRTLLHQKVMTIDGCWSAIGSTNFDSRSFELNDEVTMGIYDPAIATELEEIFERDLEFAEERGIEEWSHRTPSHKLIDFAAYLLRDQL